jgi:hypothetical protein
MTQGPKIVQKIQHNINSVWHGTVLHKPLSVNRLLSCCKFGYKSIWKICKYRWEVTVSLKKIGPVLTLDWKWVPKRSLSFHGYFLHNSCEDALLPKWKQASLENRILLHIAFSSFIFLALSCSKSVCHTEILNGNSFRLLWRILWMYMIFPTHVMPPMLISLDYTSWLPEVLLCLLANAQPVPGVIFLPPHCLPLQNYGTSKQ